MYNVKYERLRKVLVVLRVVGATGEEALEVESIFIKALATFIFKKSV